MKPAWIPGPQRVRCKIFVLLRARFWSNAAREEQGTQAGAGSQGLALPSSPLASSSSRLLPATLATL